jgi:hypothetical protein
LQTACTCGITGLKGSELIRYADAL